MPKWPETTQCASCPFRKGNDAEFGERLRLLTKALTGVDKQPHRLAIAHARLEVFRDRSKRNVSGAPAPRRHATVRVGGYTLPLIGVPARATDERCDRCRKLFYILEVHFTGRQFLCAGCLPKAS